MIIRRDFRITEKRFIGNFQGNMLVSVKDTIQDRNVNILQIVEIANKLVEENEQLKSENNMLKVTIGRNEAYIKKLTETSIWRC